MQASCDTVRWELRWEGCGRPHGMRARAQPPEMVSAGSARLSESPHVRDPRTGVRRGGQVREPARTMNAVKRGFRWVSEAAGGSPVCPRRAAASCRGRRHFFQRVSARPGTSANSRRLSPSCQDLSAATASPPLAKIGDEARDVLSPQAEAVLRVGDASRSGSRRSGRAWQRRLRAGDGGGAGSPRVEPEGIRGHR